LKPPGTKRLKLKCDVLLSTSAFKFNLRRYDLVTKLLMRDPSQRLGEAVQVNPFKPKLKPPGMKRLKPKCDILLSSFAFKFNLRRYS